MWNTTIMEIQGKKQMTTHWFSVLNKTEKWFQMGKPGNCDSAHSFVIDSLL